MEEKPVVCLTSPGIVFRELILGYRWATRIGTTRWHNRSVFAINGSIWHDARPAAIDIIERSRSTNEKKNAKPLSRNYEGRAIPREDEIRRKKGGEGCFLTCFSRGEQVATRKCSRCCVVLRRYPTVDLIFSSWKVVESAPLIRMHIPTSRNCRTRNAAP